VYSLFKISEVSHQKKIIFFGEFNDLFIFADSSITEDSDREDLIRE
jgi:hypothetical protein